MRAFVCDACGNRLTPMEEMHGAIYCDNSARRVDCCAACRKAVDRMDSPTCILLARAVLGLGSEVGS